MYCKCGTKIPEVRVKAGYKTCVKCSTEEKWGCSQVVYHKTGNTIEVIKDKELCDEINAMAKRTGFGVSAGVKGIVKQKTARTIKPLRIKEKKIALTFEQIGEKALTISSEENLDTAKKFLENCVSKKYISQYRANKILNIIESLKTT